MFVIPKPGLVFRDPVSLMRVPPEGMEVPDGSPEWTRILADGDAVIGEAPPEPEADEAAPAKPPKATPAKAPAPDAGAVDGASA